MMLVPLSVARFIGRALESVCSRSSCFCVRFGSSMCGALVIMCDCAWPVSVHRFEDISLMHAVFVDTSAHFKAH